MSQVIRVTPQQVAAAKLKIKRDRARGLPVDAATQAIADARPPRSGRTSEFRHGVADGRTG